MRRLAAIVPAVALVVLAASWPQDGQKPIGYTDTPLLPGSQWHVHDPARPAPRIVVPGDASKAPADAVVLFSGKSLDAFTGRGDKPAAWKVENGCFEANKTGDLVTKESFGSCQLHVEFCEPAPPKGESQERGNSGVFLMSRYEIQVLDSFENRTYADGQCAAVYGQTPPLVNASRPPGEWQTYDIVFTAPRFEGDKVVAPAHVTVLHNGVLVHDHTQVLGLTHHKTLPAYKPHAAEAPIVLQDHSNPVRYRNMWVRRL